MLVITAHCGQYTLFYIAQEYRDAQ